MMNSSPKIKVNHNKFNLFEYHNMLYQDIQLSYKGPFDKHILAAIGNYIKVIVRQSPKATKKVFSIFIELAQNISYYSAEMDKLANNDKETGVGTVVIGEVDSHYNFVVGNIVRNEDIIPVIDRCEVINSLNREELRRYKREQRNLPQGVHGGAHIGLIQVALTSGNPLGVDVTPISDDYSFFSLNVKIDK